MGNYKAIVKTTTTTRLEIHKPLPQPESSPETSISLTEDQKIPIEESADLVPIMQAVLRREDRHSRRKEHFWVAGLRSDSRIMYIELVSLGSATAAIVNPIEVYRLAIVNKSHEIILVHNHIDGTLGASKSDQEITGMLMKGGELLGIEILDHLIISENGYFSFLEEGLMGYAEPEETGENTECV
uniref:DNA repair protein RadC n=1 Tax=Candidatus Kentrum sp. FM TaxID=2126340 RepID=A0A450U1A9_9GAMM|nr:MAG: DNA repair protein RadC [Candidatus Kentron sp. FM]